MERLAHLEQLDPGVLAFPAIMPAASWLTPSYGPCPKPAKSYKLLKNLSVYFLVFAVG